MSRSRRLWNEHVKLVATLLNAISIGIIGVAVIGPIAQPDNPFFGLDAGVSEKFTFITENSGGVLWYDVVEWRAIAFALVIHFIAHLTMRLQVDD